VTDFATPDIDVMPANTQLDPGLCDHDDSSHSDAASSYGQQSTRSAVFGMPHVDPDIARQFLSVLDPAGSFTFQTFSDRDELKIMVRDSVTGEERIIDPLAKILHGNLDACFPALAEFNDAGAGVFLMVNQGDGHGRSIRNVTNVRALFVDLDGAPVDPILRVAELPDCIVQSSPGRWHAYWKVDDCPRDQFTILQSALARRFGGDKSVKDLPRVMRVPGFVHRKAAPFQSQLYLPQQYSTITRGVHE
jgi:hypothetical protein